MFSYSGREKNKKVIARADVRNLPFKELTRTVVRSEHETKSVLRKVIEEPVSDAEEVVRIILTLMKSCMKNSHQKKAQKEMDKE